MTKEIGSGIPVLGTPGKLGIGFNLLRNPECEGNQHAAGFGLRRLPWSVFPVALMPGSTRPLTNRQLYLL
jgi:hypothetical protein